MKIRLDFITNSSSSSFVIIGRKIDIKEVDVTKGDYICAGKYLGEGSDVFSLNSELLTYIENNVIISRLTDGNGDDNFYDEFTFYKSYIRLDNERRETITINQLLSIGVDLDEEFRFIEFDKDYQSSENTEDLRRRYLEGDDY